MIGVGDLLSERRKSSHSEWGEASASCASVTLSEQRALMMDSTRDQLETRVATLELMLVTERARPKPNEDTIAKLESDLAAAKAAVEKYDREHQ